MQIIATLVYMPQLGSVPSFSLSRTHVARPQIPRLSLPVPLSKQQAGSTGAVVPSSHVRLTVRARSTPQQAAKQWLSIMVGMMSSGGKRQLLPAPACPREIGKGGISSPARPPAFSTDPCCCCD